MTASAAPPGAPTPPNLFVRAVRAFRALGREQRISALAALVLWITMFLPWYSETGFAHEESGSAAVSLSLSAWNAFGLVQVLVLVLSLGTFVFLFARGERRALGAPLGETSIVVLSAGAAAAVLIIFGMFDRPGGGTGISTGIEWGIFLALLAAIWLAWSGVAAQRGQRHAALPIGSVIEGRERLLTRRERRGEGEPPAASGWVVPDRPSSTPPRRDDPEAQPAAGDDGQLSLELPQDHFDE
jgi:hypothetical protein